ncbi:MAG: lipid-A-disaccharide synthase [Desulfobacteraceae bacterium]|nr:lipid-A-disaccharide synthase [Desulfobacteraceae bacterium]
MPSRIMIVAGEASGDLHGANMVRALKDLAPDLSFCGMGGAEMAGQGVEILYDASRTAVVGIFEVIAHLADIRAAMRTLEERLRQDRPDLLVLIDFPDFNLILAGKAKKLGIPVFYYISPQVWAWRSGRVRKIRRRVDRMAVILPFEEEFYRRHGMTVDFVGHPLMDSVRTSGSRNELLARHGIEAETTIIGLLPGSRHKEIATLLPVFLDAARLLAREIPRPVFLLPLAPTLARADLERHGLTDSPLDVRVVSENRYNLMAACRGVMTASGTATLELAILGVPMVVCYRMSPLTYFLGKRLIQVKFASLVNLVAGRPAVPELLQDKATPEAIARELGEMLRNPERHAAICRDLSAVRVKLGGAGASGRTARKILELIGNGGAPDQAGTP